MQCCIPLYMENFRMKIMTRIIACNRFHGKEIYTLLQSYAGGIFCCQTTVGHGYCVSMLIVHFCGVELSGNLWMPCYCRGGLARDQSGIGGNGTVTGKACPRGLYGIFCEVSSQVYCNVNFCSYTLKPLSSCEDILNFAIFFSPVYAS